jgi:AAA15 family ATPase/GTPase
MSETKHLQYFKVENFKCFESFEMDDIGQFNLIVGDNNVGKTSLLEALLFDENAAQLVTNLRATYIFKNDISSELAKSFFFLKDFFFDFNISISFKFTVNKNKFEVKIKDQTALSKEEVEKIQSKNYNLINLISEYLCIYEDNNIKEIFPIRYNTSVVKNPPMVPHNIGYSSVLANIYSKEILEDKEKNRQLIQSLRIFINDIEDIKPSSEYIPKVSTLLVELKSKSKLVPLSSFGDGTLKLFRVLVKVMSASNQRLMIDEIDTGIHYSRFKEFWKTVLQSARNNNVQLFTTTHNLEGLKYFKEALDELGEEFQQKSRLFHLAKIKDGSIKAYNYSFDQFSSAIELGNEIRGRN